MDFIDLKSQYQKIQTKVDERINTVLNHGQYIMGPEIKELEERLADYVGSKHCITVSSGTDAILIALMALDVGPGDEVITTPFSFIAAAEVIALIGAKPVFVDIDPKTFNLDPKALVSAISHRTKAIIPVSLYGQCPDMDAINLVAKQKNVPVIEDAAQSFGATYKGRQSCNLSEIGCTSFFPSKPLGGYGDGGAIFTNDDDLAIAMRQIRIHGQDKRYHHSAIGLNGRLDTIQAAVLLAKLEIFPEEVAARIRIGEMYNELLKDYCKTPFIEAHNTSVFGQYTIQVPAREDLQAHLKAQGIPTAVHYPIPIHKQPPFLYLSGHYPMSEQAAREVMSLPMHPYLDEKQIHFIAESVISGLAQEKSIAV